MKEEIIQSVLEGQKEIPVSVGLLTAAVEKQSDKITEIEDKVAKLKIDVPAPDLRPVEELLAAHTQKYRPLLQPSRKTYSKLTGQCFFR